MIYIFRILGNDIRGLHHDQQTYVNLKFTLENEANFKQTKKIYILNRIIHPEKKKALVDLLRKHQCLVIDLPFDRREYNRIYFNEYDFDFNRKQPNKETFKKLRKQNLYLINNNGARNFALNYAKKHKDCEWVFPLDSNSYFTEEQFNNITKYLKNDTEALVIPQLRIRNNDHVFETISPLIKKYEPQLAFRNSSNITFNSDIPYGTSPKAELLRVLGVPGPWQTWLDSLQYHDIKDRPPIRVKTQVLSSVFRLSPHQQGNHPITNFENRIRGVYHLAKDAQRHDISVVIGIKNRIDYRITNTLISLRHQTYNKSLIQIILVDYGSEKKYIKEYQHLCRKYQCKYIRVPLQNEWSRAHCLNIGIKHAVGKYILTSDADIIFEDNYIETAIEALKKDPKQVVYCKMLDLKKDCLYEEIDIRKDYPSLKKKAIYRGELLDNINFNYGQSINLSLNAFYYSIKGYDEFYKAWGSEDIDLINRFKNLGLKTLDLSDKTSYLHQWHPRWEGTDIHSKEDERITENRKYQKKHKSIIRNNDAWGEIPKP